MKSIDIDYIYDITDNDTYISEITDFKVSCQSLKSFPIGGSHTTDKFLLIAEFSLGIEYIDENSSEIKFLILSKKSSSIIDISDIELPHLYLQKDVKIISKGYNLITPRRISLNLIATLD